MHMHTSTHGSGLASLLRPFGFHVALDCSQFMQACIKPGQGRGGVVPTCLNPYGEFIPNLSPPFSPAPGLLLSASQPHLDPPCCSQILPAAVMGFPSLTCLGLRNCSVFSMASFGACPNLRELRHNMFTSTGYDHSRALLALRSIETHAHAC